MDVQRFGVVSAKLLSVHQSDSVPPALPICLFVRKIVYVVRHPLHAWSASAVMLCGRQTPGQQLIDLLSRRIRQSGEHVGEPGGAKMALRMPKLPTIKTQRRLMPVTAFGIIIGIPGE